MDNYNKYVYTVEVRDYMRGLIIDHREFEDSNTAYRHFRILNELHQNNDLIKVQLIEPE